MPNTILTGAFARALKKLPVTAAALDTFNRNQQLLEEKGRMQQDCKRWNQRGARACKGGIDDK